MGHYKPRFGWAAAVALAAAPGALFAQAPKNQKYDELVRSAQQAEMLGYVLAGAGILLVVAAIPLSIYLERRKKAKAAKAE